MIPIVFSMLAFAVTAYMFYIGLFLFMGGIYVVWYIITSQRVEFEYSVAGDELEISKVISLRKRKRVCKVPIRELNSLKKAKNQLTE